MRLLLLGVIQEKMNVSDDSKKGLVIKYHRGSSDHGFIR